jgi:glycosyltransferase involved in cell wall biosynthesis
VKTKNWNIAFEISPILAASGSYGDKSGVYRINFNLIKYLSRYLKINHPNKKIYLYTLAPHLSFYKNLDLINLLKEDNVEFIDLEYFIVPSLKDYAIFNLPFIRYLIKIIDLFFIKILLNILFVKYVNQLDKKLKLNNVQIAHHSESGFVGLKNCLNVIHINDLCPIFFPFWTRTETISIHKRKLQFAAQHCDGIICISKNTRKDLEEYFKKFRYSLINKSKIIYLGAFEKKRSKSSLSKVNQIVSQDHRMRLKKKKYFLYFGTIEPRKNLVNLTTAFNHLDREGKINDFKLVLVGGKGWGKTYKKILEYINEQYPTITKRNIIMMDYIRDDYLVTLIKNSFAVIYPPFYEGFGLPVLEAMQLGTPVITSKTSSLPEVGGEAVLYVDPTDPETIESAILKLVKNKKLHSKLVKDGIAQASKFSWEKNAEETYLYYSSLISK